MNIVPTLFLAAVLAGPAHAQVCSGGYGGGVDATGNQCNTPNNVAAYTTGSGTTPQLQTAKMGGVNTVVSAAPPSIHSAKMSGPPSTTAVVAVPASHITRAVASPSVPARIAKLETVPASLCSGGADGGMDASGNQCAHAPAIAEINLASPRTKR
jgi:hypothetical protein